MTEKKDKSLFGNVKDEFIFNLSSSGIRTFLVISAIWLHDNSVASVIRNVVVFVILNREVQPDPVRPLRLLGKNKSDQIKKKILAHLKKLFQVTRCIIERIWFPETFFLNNLTVKNYRLLCKQKASCEPQNLGSIPNDSIQCALNLI